MEDERASDYTVEVTRDTMLGDLMSLVIDEIRAAPDAWDRLPEHKQQEVITRVEKRVAAVISDCVQLIATDNRPSIPATLKEVNFKEGIKAVLTVSKGCERRHELSDAVGMGVLVVVPSIGAYSGGVRPKATPNQGALPLDPTDDTPEQRQMRVAEQEKGAALEEAARAVGESLSEGASDVGSQADVDAASEVRAAEGKRRAFIVTPFYEPSKGSEAAAPFGVWAVDKEDAWRVFSGRTRDAGEKSAYAIAPGKKADLDVIGCINPMDSPSRKQRAAQREDDMPASERIPVQEPATHESATA